jgi:gamma-glutamyltranspeptidase/glutathione hydrolase
LLRPDYAADLSVEKWNLGPEHLLLAHRGSATHVLEGKTFISKNCAVATEHPLSSLAAFEVLEKGGNAVDAAVAGSFCISVVHPQLSGLGGDFFALAYMRREEKVYCINSSGWSPQSLTVDAMKSEGAGKMPTYGPMSVVIPGYVKGLGRLHEKLGSMEFSGLLSRAIEYAESGFPVTRGLAESIKTNQQAIPEAARGSLMPHGRPPRVGELVRQEVLGKTLRSVASDGVDAFYRGRAAEGIRSAISKGHLEVAPEDMGDFEPEWCDPISVEYRGSRVYEVPPNSMGATTLAALKFLEHENMARMRPNSSKRISITLAAALRAYVKRDELLGDTRFVKFELDDFLYGPDTQKRDGPSSVRIKRADTTYFAISDKEGNLLSCIQSLFHHFGSRVYVKEGGFFLNNRASAFSFSGPNRLEPRKRPLHTLSTLLIDRERRPAIALGCSGGDFRPQQHVLFVTNILDYSMSLEQAIGFPRFLWEGGRDITIEEGYEGLGKIRPRKKVVGFQGRTGVAQGVEELPGAKKAVCDLRGDGIPLGN